MDNDDVDVLRDALAVAIDEIIPPLDRPSRVCVREVEARVDAQLAIAVAREVAMARRHGATEAEIKAYLRIARIATRAELERIVPEIVAWLRGSTLVAAPKRPQ